MLYFNLLHVLLIAIGFLPHFCFSVLDLGYETESRTVKMEDIPDAFEADKETMRNIVCEAKVRKIKNEERKKVVHDQPILQGTWVSERCEVREGPQFITRRLSIDVRLTFQLIIFHYNESSCMEPTFSIIAKGPIHNRPNNPDLRRKTIKLKKLAIFGYDHSRFREGLQKICPSLHGPIKFNKEYNLLKKVHYSLRCPTIYENVMRELSFLQTQVVFKDRQRFSELLTAYPENDISNYFEPLLSPSLRLADMRHASKLSHLIADATVMSPPLLGAEKNEVIAPTLFGEWISEKCESTGHGNFVMKVLTFQPGSTNYTMTETFYSDHFCKEAILTEEKFGSFTLGKPSEVITDGYNVEITVRRPITGKIQNERNYDWTRRSTVVRWEFNKAIIPTMIIGELAEDNQRSTSFLPPLVLCSPF